jgi:transcription elongation GreA/GreB family factor
MLRVLDSRIAEIETAIASTKEARDNESKSSAGDKYETGRAMLQIELDNLEHQLKNQLELKTEILRVNPELTTEKISFGSLISSTNGTYFIAIGLGKILIGNETVYAISLASPLGQALKGAQKDNTISLNGKSITINHVL